MKKKLIIIYLLYLCVITGYIFLNVQKNCDMVKAQVYYIDSDMLRLISVDCTLKEEQPEKQAKAIISELIAGKDKIKKVKRMIPGDADCIDVKVFDDTAVVDIKNPDDFPEGRVAENLVVYQIVNSLTSIGGIDKVRFTIDGKILRDFKGFMDMRETYIADLYV